MTELMTHQVRPLKLLIRRTPGRDGYIKFTLRRGTRLMFLDYDPVFASGRQWRAIEAESGLRGWVDTVFLSAIKPVAARELPQMWYS